MKIKIEATATPWNAQTLAILIELMEGETGEKTSIQDETDVAQALHKLLDNLHNHDWHTQVINSFGNAPKKGDLYCVAKALIAYEEARNELL